MLQFMPLVSECVPLYAAMQNIEQVLLHMQTRMVQLPATAAIEYVVACWVSGARGIFDLFPGGLLPGGTFARWHFWPGGFFSGGAFVWGGGFCPGGLLPGGGLLSGRLMPVPPKFNAYTHRLGFLCLAS